MKILFPERLPMRKSDRMSVKSFDLLTQAVVTFGRFGGVFPAVQGEEDNQDVCSLRFKRPPVCFVWEVFIFRLLGRSIS